jgi:hypothetical protein
MAKETLKSLASHQRAPFRFLQAGQETWPFNGHVSPTQWALSWEDSEEKEWRSHGHRTTIMIHFFGGKSPELIDILPKTQKMTTGRRTAS